MHHEAGLQGLGPSIVCNTAGFRNTECRHVVGNIIWLVKCDSLTLAAYSPHNHKFPIVSGKFMVCVRHRLQYQTITFYQRKISNHSTPYFSTQLKSAVLRYEN